MNYLNITIADLKRPEFIESEYDHIGVWLSLMAYCATVENGGVIANCSKWGDKQWGAVGVTKSYILESSPLWTLEDEGLVVSFYPVDQEASLKAKREAGKKGGRPKKVEEVKADTYNDKNHMVSSEGNHMVSSEHNVKERKGKEGNSNSKGIGKKGNEKEEEIYSHYPKKTGRAAALKSITKALTKVSFDELLETVKVYAEKTKWKEKTYIPNPATWFNQERWADDQSEWEQPKPSKPSINLHQAIL